MDSGSLVLTAEGAVLESAGDLQNDERAAHSLLQLVSLAQQIDPVAFPKNDGFKKITITYEDHCFIICMSNKKIHVVKKSLNSASDHLESNTVNA
ncbi:late endosomal/lysosomal adaptor, MAPK and MTOR activator 4 [Arctopsyche grandis]|uniref:late endosomal/lysosomal adaptor, MAPK and MTOR activator 4 n=1 Tax=Arctopsyche grandis TaxID=121162 RepID=UPI00406D79A0